MWGPVFYTTTRHATDNYINRVVKAQVIQFVLRDGVYYRPINVKSGNVRIVPFDRVVFYTAVK